MARTEILAPVGSEEMLRAAVFSGADAVYLGGKNFGMRAGAKNFDAQGLAAACKMAHDRGVKVYLTCNTVPLNGELDDFPQFIAAAQDAGIDAVIAAERFIDSAVMSRLKTVTIIHGKGTGALRNAVQAHLKRMKYVKSFHLGEFGEGDAGVTIAEFKE